MPALPLPVLALACALATPPPCPPPPADTTSGITIDTLAASPIPADTLEAAPGAFPADTATFFADTAVAAAAAPRGKATTLTLAAVGDIMPGTSFPTADYLAPGDDAAALFDDVRQAIDTCDLAFGNLEGCYLDTGQVAKRCSDPARCFAFRSPERYFGAVADAGFDIMSIANNHAFDFGPAGVESTLRLADSAGVAAAGSQGRPWAVVERQGIKVGMAAFAPNKGTASLHDHAAARELIRRLDTLCDIVVVSFHAGAEGSKHQHVTRSRETFYGEDRGDVYHFARMAIDAGADILLGHGPHVLRAVDIYKERFIAYSLGNFCTPTRMNLSYPNNLAPVLQIRVDAQGRFVEGRVVSFAQQKGQGPRRDPRGQAAAKIKELTEADLPETAIRVAADGTISHR